MLRCVCKHSERYFNGSPPTLAHLLILISEKFLLAPITQTSSPTEPGPGPAFAFMPASSCVQAALGRVVKEHQWAFGEGEWGRRQEKPGNRDVWCWAAGHPALRPQGNRGLSCVPAVTSLSWTHILLSVFSDADGNLCRSNQLLQVMLTMHRILISSADLLQKVMALYP